ncbi:MAG: hypothetical protein JWM10_4271 [Myxococcaceae bacterium]|nr:hypothetical protein [Myxococcaceae bacterium]
MQSARRLMFWAALALAGVSGCSSWYVVHPTVNGRAFVSRDGEVLNCDAAGDHPRCWHVRQVVR